MAALARTENSFSILDWIGVVVAVMATIALFAFPFFVAPSFQAMFADFGSEIPEMTNWVLKPWVPLLLGLASAILIGLGLRAKRIETRRFFVVAAFGFSCASFAFVWTGIYLPIFRVSASVR